MKTLKSQLLGLVLLLGATITLDAQGLAAPFESMIINESAEEDRIETSANTEISQHIVANLKYPEHLKEFKISGTSLVKFRINEKGEVTSKHIITSLGESFDSAIMNSTKDLQVVSPIYKNGVAAAYAIVVPVRFEL